jgi:hypothetical protein
MTRSRFVTLVLTALSYAACAGCASSRPKAIDQIYSTYENNRVTTYTNYDPAGGDPLAGAETDKTKRNRVMNDLILLIDSNYYKIEKGLVGHKTWADFSGSLAVTGLSTAGTIVGATGTKTILSALVTAINSTKTSVDKDLLQGQTLIAIIAKMRQLRAAKMVDVRKSMKLGPNDYTLSYGLVDLLEYYDDGTFAGALQSMTEDAAAGTKDAKQALQDLKGTYSYTDDSKALRIYWKPNGVVNTDHAAAFNKWLQENENGVDITTFLYSSKYVGERSKAAAALVK